MIENCHQILTRNPKKKVKTGCLTCKARHVKCDEGWPACHRCVSTRRNCDGYGIWGGGGTVCRDAGQARSRIVPLRDSSNPNPPKPDLPSHFNKMSKEQVSIFSWFKHSTYVRLPLPYTTSFWHTLVLQACAAEPPVLHAALALGSAHHKETFGAGADEGPVTALDAQQRFMLQEYSQAIRGLQPHFSRQDKNSIHVALVTCALFTFLENLLGRYVAAKAHLHCGLRLLAQVHAPVGHSVDSPAVTEHHRGYTYDCIVEVFMRLHVQSALLGQGLLSLYSRLPVFPLDPIPTAFQSVRQAGNHLDRLLLGILHLAEQCAPNKNRICPTPLPGRLLSCKQQIQVELGLWLSAYNSTMLEVIPPVERFYMMLPRAYHTMANILLSSCTWPACETAFDSSNGEFLLLITQLVEIWTAHLARSVWRLESRGPPQSPFDRSLSVGDKGWLPLLYFIAVKCRVHRIRHQAVRLLAKTLHKEGTWNATLVQAVARKIVRLEEGSFYDEFSRYDNFSDTDIPTEEDLMLPVLPDCCRLYNVQLQLPEDPVGVLTLEYDIKEKDAKGFERKGRRYHLQARCWSDTVVEK
ncbi:hypothetical protein F5Y17DRAFT_428451 [Xylariaceae sp. FL0594]|nr:hypothetical protein F5Y17DRAFT_428451 [Xylariaceae sp. FL0594]